MIKVSKAPLALFFGTLASTLAAPLAWSATAFVFEVDSTVYEPLNNNQWQAFGSAQYQFTLVVDDTQVSTADVAPEMPAMLYDSYQDISMPVIGVSGESEDAIAVLRSGADLGVSTTVSQTAMSSETASTLLGDSQVLSFVGRVSERHETGDAFTRDGQGIQPTYQYTEGFDLRYNTYNDVDPQPMSLEDFLALTSDVVGVEGAFSFSHSALAVTEECLVDQPTFCPSLMDPGLVAALGLSIIEIEGIRYSGTATLLSVTPVPLPAAGWLFVSALSLLGLFRGKRR